MAVQSNDNDLKDLLNQVGKGELQLPEFQRSWIWDDDKICKLIESVTMGFPMGALMFLETGGDVNYKPRLFTGVDQKFIEKKPEYLVLDGQQRLTTLYQVFMGKGPVETCYERNRNATIYRYYYLDILKALDENADREEAIISISNQKIKTSDIGKTIDLDLRTRDDEFKNMMFPLNLLFSDDCDDWLDDLEALHKDEFDKYRDIKKRFKKQIITPVLSYKLPVIKVLKSTSQASVCQIFENVNRGGVPLNVFELVTASLAAEGVELRKEWDDIKKEFDMPQYEVLRDIDGTDFITSMTLWESYEQFLDGAVAVKCKKKDVLGLRKSVFEGKKDRLKSGFIDAARFVMGEGVYTSANLPYKTQLIPLAAIFAFDNSHQKVLKNRPNHIKLSCWYWCGVFGELYGSALESRYALDIKDFFVWTMNDATFPDTVVRSSFQATRLLSMKSRNSAAYKGMMALILQNGPLDFATGSQMSVQTYTMERTDIHHIFPANYCDKAGLPQKKWDSIVNKTMINYATNRSIGGVAPSRYIQKLFKENVDTAAVKNAISSHMINFDLLNEDRFDEFIIDRAGRLLDCIENATGKIVAGRDSEETIKAFGAVLETHRKANS